ncbi:nicotinate phosphoribosyltransferase [Pontimonas salivibrio]|uniref:Nicotinate phosphoribosyltransferase n=1 Tax=Pontimonas salivibrio TaxID=1159327 RepID=A0A2L2BS19_9MICO|nr:nicotinate phosphoribosyltransferase [Pontimonas salivibrio]AVG24458.1 nicotinate phosphoribosyltransferase [Pontimonas salivibrio]
MSSALLTDHYELTMVDAARHSGRASRRSVFEVFARRLPSGRRYGVVAGTQRLIDEIEKFHFGDEELAFLSDNSVVGEDTLNWLADYRFSGTIRGYREGEIYFPHSPILQVEGTFEEACLVETLVLSVLNHDTAIASAASRMVQSAGGRPLIEMGSRRTSEHAAWAAARAAYLVGFSHTSNLEAGRRFGIPTLGTAAHAFTLLHDSEEEAFRAQIATLGSDTTLLVDTFDVERAVERAISVAGPNLGAVRIDSGDLPVVVRQVREQLDRLGATSTRIVVTNDLDEYTIAALQASPVDAYGVGTSVVTGSGHPAAGLVYKLVSRQDDSGQQVSVSKTSVGKANPGGQKKAVRVIKDGIAQYEQVMTGETLHPDITESRELLVDYMSNGERLEHDTSLSAAREHHLHAIAELPPHAFRLADGEPAIETVIN